MVHGQNRNSVQLLAVEGQWVVRIVENGDVVEQRYERQEFANSFASGQAIRLGVSVTPQHHD